MSEKKLEHDDYVAKKADMANIKQKEQTQQYPSELIDLPSQGLIYPESNPLSSGTITLKYMTAKEEDILTSQNLISKGVVLDKLYESMILDDINTNDIFIGDKSAIMIASRILGYGKNYMAETKCPACSATTNVEIDLTELEDKPVELDLLNRDNLYEFTFPHSKKSIIFKLLTWGDEKQIDNKLKAYKKAQSKMNSEQKSNLVQREFTVRLKHMVQSVDGNDNKNTISNFIDNCLSLDTKALRKYIKQLSPGIDTTYLFECDECGYSGVHEIPMTSSFFWPNTEE